MIPAILQSVGTREFHPFVTSHRIDCVFFAGISVALTFYHQVAFFPPFSVAATGFRLSSSSPASLHSPLFPHIFPPTSLRRTGSRRRRVSLAGVRRRRPSRLRHQIRGNRRLAATGPARHQRGNVFPAGIPRCDIIAGQLPLRVFLLCIVLSAEYRWNWRISKFSFPPSSPSHSSMHLVSSPTRRKTPRFSSSCDRTSSSSPISQRRQRWPSMTSSPPMKRPSHYSPWRKEPKRST